MAVVAGARSVDFFGSRWTLGRRGLDGLFNDAVRLSVGVGFADPTDVLRPSLAWASRAYTSRVIGDPCVRRIDS